MAFAVLLVVACCATWTAGAQAGEKLVLLNEGVPLKDGGKAFSELRIATCLQFTEGKLVANAKGSDKLTFTKVTNSKCESGWSSTGHIEKVSLSAKGTAVETADFELTVPGNCKYTFKHFKDTFGIPGFAVLEGEEVGKLDKKGSAPGCEPTLHELWEADVDIAAFGSPLETAFFAS